MACPGRPDWKLYLGGFDPLSECEDADEDGADAGELDGALWLDPEDELELLDGELELECELEEDELDPEEECPEPEAPEPEDE